MTVLAGAAIVAAAIVWAALRLRAGLTSFREDRVKARTEKLFGTFAPAIAAAAQDPQALLVWEPLARTARTLFPAEFAELDRAAGGAFPFAKERIQAAHAQWTAAWLAWERAHDAEFKLKAAALNHELASAEDQTLARARLDAVEQEKLTSYQRRYEEYVKVAKALQALA
jgi:hypothetical protein